MSQADGNLFRIMQYPSHCLNNILPKLKEYSMNLRSKGHSFELPQYQYDFFRESFVHRSLFAYVVEPRDASSDGTALAKCSRSSQLQGRHAGLSLSTRSCSAIPVVVTTSSCGHGLPTSTQVTSWHWYSCSAAVPADYSWRPFVSGCRAASMEWSAGSSALSIIVVVVWTTAEDCFIFSSLHSMTFLTHHSGPCSLLT